MAVALYSPRVWAGEAGSAATALRCSELNYLAALARRPRPWPPPWRPAAVRACQAGRGEQFCTDTARLDTPPSSPMAHPGRNAERDARIYGRRKDGLTLAAIGLEFRLSKETVRTVVRQMRLKAWWREIENNTQRERLARLAR
jgi:hypothetical protein